MAEITREGGLNSGLPDHQGLDDDTRSALRRQADKEGKAVVVGGVQDFQKYFGEKALDDSEEIVEVPRGETPDSVMTSQENDELTAAATAGTATVDDSNTKEEIQAALDEQGIDYSSSDTKAELLEKLNG